MIQKTSIRYFIKTPVRAVWDKADACWFYSAVDVVAALTDSKNPRIYWNTCKRRNPELNAFCRQLKLAASDGKEYLSDCIGQAGIDKLVMVLPGKYRAEFSDWIAGKLSPLDEQSKRRAYELWDSPILDESLIGTIESLQQIHAFLFDGLYDFAGKIRTRNISKGGFQFANCHFFDEIFGHIESMPETSVDEIIDKYIEMNIAHPFMEGNGRATRIWLDMLLKRRLGLCVDWQRIDKTDYLDAMEQSVVDAGPIHDLISKALTDRVDDRELFMKGIDYCYYYEEIDDGMLDMTVWKTPRPEITT